MFHASRYTFHDKGQAVLSLVLLIGGIVAFVGVTLAFIVLSFINSTSGFERSSRALAVADGGIRDALIHLARDKDFSSAQYTIPVGSFYANVSIAQNIPLPSHATILSQAIVSSYERRMQAVVHIASSTGEVRVLSLGEVVY